MLFIILIRKQADVFISRTILKRTISSGRAGEIEMTNERNGKQQDDIGEEKYSLYKIILFKSRNLNLVI